MDQQAKSHLGRDKILSSLIEKFQIKEYRGGRKDYFLDLVETVIGQQLSIKAAKSIFNRFLAQYKDKPTPALVITTPDQDLRTIGLSGSKVGYIKNIAEAVSSGTLLLDHLDSMSDQEITKELTKIKGIGPWSVDMFLIFTLKRPDVFSIGDLGLRTAVERLYGINRDDKVGILALSQNWSPYRTMASRLLWSSLDKD